MINGVQGLVHRTSGEDTIDRTNETSYWFLRALSRSAAPIHSHYMYVLPPFLKRGNFLSESMVPGMAGF